jgi:hypothetical protein
MKRNIHYWIIMYRFKLAGFLRKIARKIEGPVGAYLKQDIERAFYGDGSGKTSD